MIQANQPLMQAREQYDKLGYCVLDGIFSASELQDMEDFFENYRQREDTVFESKGGQWRQPVKLEEVDKTKQQVRVLHPHRLDPRVMDWYLHPNIAATLELLLGKPALGAQTMFYYKPPGAKGQGMHQDNFYLLAAPAACIGAWTPLDDATDENGCLWVVPGSHREGILCPEKSRAERWLNYGDSHISQFPRDTKPVCVPVMRGQTMFFHGMLIHGSGPNRSTSRWRRTFIGHYCDEATASISKFYHPVLNMKGETVSVAEHSGGGPCDDGWAGAQH